MKFLEIFQWFYVLFMLLEFIIINYVISVDLNDQKKIVCYDIDVEVDDILKIQMNFFLLFIVS